MLCNRVVIHLTEIDCEKETESKQEIDSANGLARVGRLF